MLVGKKFLIKHLTDDWVDHGLNGKFCKVVDYDDPVENDLT